MWVQCWQRRHRQEDRISRPMSDNLWHVKTICRQVSEQNLRTCNNIKRVIRRPRQDEKKSLDSVLWPSNSKRRGSRERGNNSIKTAVILVQLHRICPWLWNALKHRKVSKSTSSWQINFFFHKLDYYYYSIKFPCFHRPFWRRYSKMCVKTERWKPGQ